MLLKGAPQNPILIIKPPILYIPGTGLPRLQKVLVKPRSILSARGAAYEEIVESGPQRTADEAGG